MDFFSIAFDNISVDRYLRIDKKYHEITSGSGFNIFHSKAKNKVSLSEIIREDYENFQYEDGIEYKGIPTGQTYIDEDGEMISYQTVTLDDHPNRLKYKISKNHILISSLRLAKSPALLYENIDFEKCVFSNGFYSFLVSNEWNQKYVLYLLRTNEVKKLIDNNIYRGIGISSYKAEDLLKIKVRNVPIQEQESAVEKIREIERGIAGLKAMTASTQEIIDKVFGERFGFDYQKLEAFKKSKIYHLEQQDFGNNLDLRFSVKYHRPAGVFVKKQLAGITNKKIKHFLAVPIALGASVSPEDFDEKGDAYYVSMATIKTLEIELDETQLISKSFYQTKKDKALEKGDIVMARSGVAIGKAAIVKEDFKGIFADFTMRIRFDSQKYNPMFGYYYLRSKYFQYLIELYKKGLQNQNIFPIVMQELPAPDLSLEEQRQIVEEIGKEIEKQKDLYSKIAGLRSRISNIIEETLCR